MADSTTTTLRLTKPTVGGDSGTWGTILDSDYDYIDEAIGQSVTVNVADANASLTADGSSSDQARYRRYNITGAWTADRTITLPANEKFGLVSNGTTGGHNAILTTGSGVRLLVPSTPAIVQFYCDGTNVYSPCRTQGALGGLTLSNDGSAPNTVIDVAAGYCADSTDTVLMWLPAFTKSTAGLWAAGSGSNGMGTGLTIANSTWYHVFVVAGTYGTDVYFDTSVTAANKPTGTSYYRRIGSFKTDGSAHILAFSQNGDEFLWLASPQDVNVTNLGTSRTLYALSVPPGIKGNALIYAGASFASGSVSVLLTSPDQNDVAAGLSTGISIVSPPTANSYAFGQFNVRFNTSQQIGARASVGSANLNINTQGWIDTRGRFA